MCLHRLPRRAIHRMTEHTFNYTVTTARSIESQTKHGVHRVQAPYLSNKVQVKLIKFTSVPANMKAHKAYITKVDTREAVNKTFVERFSEGKDATNCFRSGTLYRRGLSQRHCSGTL